MDERIVMVDSGTGLKLTEEQLDDRSAVATVQLRRRGVRAGDTVLICLPVGPDLLVSANAVIAAGGVVWPLPPDLDTATLRDRIQESGARVMISNVRQALDAADESRVRIIMSVADLSVADLSASHSYPTGC
ncbi:acyl-coenzyme A synthetase/AMP-(fatty) acid ligase [Nonomuraea thailandensis]|uniref:Acyl-coenzyme A synthetase/AMP-(Fatty) acid ligase n=1 Tax=Nonomuraea thailandensis TaxID=1188745 RepID=A0A9X2GTU6_9ACTN|nr:AMP-binding protein [Nonomuraea thailandensis]MCP2365016.1 acyl-coenzyme A synthetase/AMP-(fatty) acid ligase [Nonomuraea thailandensis]